MKNKIIPAKKIRQYYKRFADGEQYIEIDPLLGIVEQGKFYYWQSRKVFNHISLLIDLYGDDLNEEALYGRHGLVSLLEPYQREYNRIMNLHSDNIMYSTYGFIAVEDGSVDADELNEEGIMAGKVLIYRQGANPPELKKDTLNTNLYLESAKYCLNQMVVIAANFRDSHKRSVGYEK